MNSITAIVDMFKMTTNWRSGVDWKGKILQVDILLYTLKGKYMCMINRKDDNVIFLILSCHQFPLCVCANRSVAEGQIRAPLGRVNAPQYLSFDPLCIHARVPPCALPLGFAFLPSSLLEHINAPIKILSAFLSSPLCMFSFGSWGSPNEAPSLSCCRLWIGLPLYTHTWIVMCLILCALVF